MAKKRGGQIFQQESSSQNTILMVLIGVLVLWILYKAFFKSCKPAEVVVAAAAPAAAVAKEKYGGMRY